MSLEQTGALLCGLDILRFWTVRDFYRRKAVHGRAMLNDHEWIVCHFGEFWHCSGWFDDVRVYDGDTRVEDLQPFVVKRGRPRKIGLDAPSIMEM